MAARTLRLVNSWETVRYELLNTRICDLGLGLEQSPMQQFVDRLYNELDAKKLKLQPTVYLSDNWGCPDMIPVIGIPFYLADPRLCRIEEEQAGFIETRQMIMMLLRHEAGHAVNYAYRLYKQPDWVEAFGPFSKPYRDTFRPNPFSRRYVRHLEHHRHGRTYAQKHPDEDFAETFAVWLTPRSGWRRRYQNWPALRKLELVDRLMKEIRNAAPKQTTGRLHTPVEEMTMLLAEHYGARANRYRAAAQGYVDDKLQEIFPRIRDRYLQPAGELFRKHGRQLQRGATRWSGLPEIEIAALLQKLQERAEFLELNYRRRHAAQKVLDVTSLVTALAMDFAYTGQFTA